MVRYWQWIKLFKLFIQSNYSHEYSIKFLTKSIKSSLCDYSDVYISVTGNIAVTRTIAAADSNPI